MEEVEVRKLQKFKKPNMLLITLIIILIIFLISMEKSLQVTKDTSLKIIKWDITPKLVLEVAF